MINIHAPACEGMLEYVYAQHGPWALGFSVDSIYTFIYCQSLILCKHTFKINTYRFMIYVSYCLLSLISAKTKLCDWLEIIKDREHGLLKLSQENSQEGYLTKVLHKYEMEGANVVVTLLAQHFKLSMGCAPKTEEEVQLIKNVPYSEFDVLNGMF